MRSAVQTTLAVRIVFCSPESHYAVIGVGVPQPISKFGPVLSETFHFIHAISTPGCKSLHIFQLQSWLSSSLLIFPPYPSFSIWFILPSWSYHPNLFFFIKSIFKFCWNSALLILIFLTLSLLLSTAACLKYRITAFGL